MVVSALVMAARREKAMVREKAKEKATVLGEEGVMEGGWAAPAELANEGGSGGEEASAIGVGIGWLGLEAVEAVEGAEGEEGGGWGRREEGSGGWCRGGRVLTQGAKLRQRNPLPPIVPPD